MINKKEILNELKYFLNNKTETLIIRGEKTNGLLETMLSSMIFYSPNFLFLIPYYQDKIFLFLAYNFVMIFLLVSTIAHLKFNTNK